MFYVRITMAVQPALQMIELELYLLLRERQIGMNV